MADEWYSDRPRSRFSEEHRRLPKAAHMVDCDGVLFVLYELDAPNVAVPLMVVELKPENAREKGWYVAQALAARMRIAAALVIELSNGRYRVHVATEVTGYQPRQLRGEFTIEDWFEKVERPLRERYEPQGTIASIEEVL